MFLDGCCLGVCLHASIVASHSLLLFLLEARFAGVKRWLANVPLSSVLHPQRHIMLM